MAKMSVEQIYEQHVKPLPASEQLRLVEMIAQRLAEESSRLTPKRKRSLMELHGSGKEIWEGVDAQEYINELRREWNYPHDVSAK